MNAWHQRHGGNMKMLDGWKRVQSYGNLPGEETAILEAVGICDVTPCAKLTVEGKNSGEMVRTLTGSKNLMPGTCITPKLLESDLDNIQIACLSPENFLILGPPGKERDLMRHLKNYACVHTCTHMMDVTSAYAAIQLAGPHAGALLRRMSAAQFAAVLPDNCVQTKVAGVKALCIHQNVHQGNAWVCLVARDFGEYVWESIVESGKEFGVQPFGFMTANAVISAEKNDVAAL